MDRTDLRRQSELYEDEVLHSAEYSMAPKCILCVLWIIIFTVCPSTIYSLIFRERKMQSLRS